MKDTKIEWTNSTGGPWLICTEVSPGCAHCYARELMLLKLAPLVRKAYQAAGFADWETRPVWGDSAPRVLTKGFWKDMLVLNRKAPDGHKCFPSLIDWLDEMPAGIIDQDGNVLDPLAVFGKFLRMIYDTPRLTWILSTKRPEAWRGRMEKFIVTITDGTGNEGEFWQWCVDWMAGKPPRNVWILTTVECRSQEKRVADVLNIPAVVHGISAEPLLEPLTFTNFYWQTKESDGRPKKWIGTNNEYGLGKKIDWLIIGGESGTGRRDCGVEAILETARLGKLCGCQVFIKQDSSHKPGAKGRIPDDWWKLKEFPLLQPA
jgi:protein gp37